MFDIFWSPLGASGADVMGGTSLTLSAVLASFPLKCQASSVLRCSTVYLLPLLGTLLIDAICAVITPLVIKQHFSLPVSGCQALFPCSVFFFSPFPINSWQWLKFTQTHSVGGSYIRKSVECEEKVADKFKNKKETQKTHLTPHLTLVLCWHRFHLCIICGYTAVYF